MTPEVGKRYWVSLTANGKSSIWRVRCMTAPIGDVVIVMDEWGIEFKVHVTRFEAEIPPWWKRLRTLLWA